MEFWELVRAAEKSKSRKAFLEKYNFTLLKKWYETRVWSNGEFVIKDEGQKASDEPPKDIVETAWVEIRKKVYLIQPLVEPGDDKASRKLYKRNKDWYDPGKNNCGYYRGEPVIIDW